MIFYPYIQSMGEATSGICSINETLTVLFVDDELAMREIVQEMFSEDFAVRTAHSGRQALARVDQEVDVVVTDLKMPGMNGDELADKLQAQRPNLPVLFVSGVPCETGNDAEFDCDNYLEKPVDFQEICTLISEQHTSEQ
jgi:CheY-like chemotaxis protein